MEARKYIPHYTASDYEQWQGDWELWHGAAVAMSPSPSVRHQTVAANLASLLHQQLAGQEVCHCKIAHELDWRIADDLIVRPDIVVYCEPAEGAYLIDPPALIVEVLSPSTRDKDRHAKRELYGEQGVKHYVMVEPEDGQVEVLTLAGGAYREAENGEAALHDDCRITIPAILAL